MSRVVNTNNPGKTRSRWMRLSAELLRRLSQKAELDGDAKDMAAQLVYCLREIDDGIEASAAVWEKRDYWIKAEQLRQRWAWAGNAAASLERVVRDDAWDSLPGMMVALFAHFGDIKVTKFMRDSSEWRGAYQRLKDEFR
jgi:hypothetical protein